jgi:hypothetical protein
MPLIDLWTTFAPAPVQAGDAARKRLAKVMRRLLRQVQAADCGPAGSASCTFNCQLLPLGGLSWAGLTRSARRSKVFHARGFLSWLLATPTLGASNEFTDLRLADASHARAGR